MGLISMRIIDKNGRIFGKINVIDFLVIIFLMSFTPMLSLVYNIFRKKPVRPPRLPTISSISSAQKTAEFLDIELNCNFVNLTKETLKLIKIGDYQLIAEGEKIGEIIWIGESSPLMRRLDIGSKFIEIPVQTEIDLFQIPVKLKIKVEIAGDRLYYNGRMVADNNPIVFKTIDYEAEATLKFDGSGQLSDSILKGFGR